MLERQLAYWRERLAGAPASLDLPTDRPRPAVHDLRGGRSHLRPCWTGPARRLAGSPGAQRGATLFMVLLAASRPCSRRSRGQEDLPVGSPIANRNRAEIEPLIGFFVNTLVLRADLAGDPTFRELLARVRQTTLEAYAHQDLPFEQLVEELRRSATSAVNPLFQVMCALQNAPERRVELPGLSRRALDSEPVTAHVRPGADVWPSAVPAAVFTSTARDLFDARDRRPPGCHLREPARRRRRTRGLRALGSAAARAAGERHQLLAGVERHRPPAAAARAPWRASRRRPAQSPDAAGPRALAASA